MTPSRPSIRRDEDNLLPLLFPPTSGEDPGLLRVGRPGLLRTVGVGVLDELLRAPDSADRLMARRFRSERRLGSRDRRVVKQVVLTALRRERLLRRLLAQGGWDGARPGAALWSAAVVLLGGPAPEPEDQGLSFQPLRAPQSGLKRWMSSEAVSAAALIACATSLPDWMVSRWVSRWGAQRTARLASALNQQAPVALRANTRRVQRDALAIALREQGLSVCPGALASTSLLLQGRGNAVDTPAWRRGLFEVQDEASQLVCELVQAPRGGLVIDLCAGAGGKTLGLAASLPKGAQLLATDVREAALQEARRRLKRAGARQVRVETIGLGRGPSVAPGQAARVLVDAPCTGTGTLRRKPGLRARLTPEWLQERVRIQTALIQQASELVRPGGRLIYATCSLMQEENQDVVQGFLARSSDWRSVGVPELLGSARSAALGQGEVLELAPDLHGCDGFFAAVLQAPAAH